MHNKEYYKHKTHHYKVLSYVIVLIPMFFQLNVFAISPGINDFDSVTLRNAAENIVQKVDQAASNSVLIVCSKGKKDFASWIIKTLEDRKIHHYQLILGGKPGSNINYFQTLIKDLAKDWGLIFLIDPPDAPFLFATVGRPDKGIQISEDYLFCDWLAKIETTIRTNNIDIQELHKFRQLLLNEVNKAQSIRITTSIGTDVTIVPRHWNQSDGEIWTPPIETRSHGRIVVGGTAYGGPVAKQFILNIENGRVVNISDLDQNDRQQKMVQKDLTRDGNSNVLAEFGIGINDGAMSDKDLMESEQARGTCHFGFGMNLMFGGQNESSYHIDFVIFKPTIEVDGKLTCKDGEYQFNF